MSVKVIKLEKSKYIFIYGIYIVINFYINLYCSIVKEYYIVFLIFIIFLFVRIIYDKYEKKNFKCKNDNWKFRLCVNMYKYMIIFYFGE